MIHPSKTITNCNTFNCRCCYKVKVCIGKITNNSSMCSVFWSNVYLVMTNNLTKKVTKITITEFKVYHQYYQHFTHCRHISSGYLSYDSYFDQKDFTGPSP